MYFRKSNLDEAISTTNKNITTLMIILKTKLEEINSMLFDEEQKQKLDIAFTRLEAVGNPDALTELIHGLDDPGSDTESDESGEDVYNDNYFLAKLDEASDILSDLTKELNKREKLYEENGLSDPEARLRP